MLKNINVHNQAADQAAAIQQAYHRAWIQVMIQTPNQIHFLVLNKVRDQVHSQGLGQVFNNVYTQVFEDAKKY